MNLHKLAREIKKVVPTVSDCETAQLCLLLLHHSEAELTNESRLESLVKRVRIQLEHSCDQYGAVTQELQQLAESNPQEFDQDQVWILLRAIKIQDQLIKLHLGGEPLNV